MPPQVGEQRGAGAPLFAPIARQNVPERIREVMLESIRSGDLKSGQVVPSERRLADEFGVARATVREAMQGLITLGVIEKRGNGFYVLGDRLPALDLNGLDRTKRLVEDLFEMRAMIEVPLIKLVVERASDHELDQIMDFALATQKSTGLLEYRKCDKAFHWAIAKAGRNAIFSEIYEKVWEAQFSHSEFETLLESQANVPILEQMNRDSGEAHVRIAHALATRDADAAAAKIVEYLDQIRERILKGML